MKYQISLVIASALTGLMLFALSYWGFGVEMKWSLILGISTAITGLVTEWIRPMFKKKTAGDQ